MDPNATLSELLALARRVIRAAEIADIKKKMDREEMETFSDVAVAMAERVQYLDEWLTKGGFLPERWQRERSRTGTEGQ
jgi:hypothetical protein